MPIPRAASASSSKAPSWTSRVPAVSERDVDLAARGSRCRGERGGNNHFGRAVAFGAARGRGDCCKAPGGAGSSAVSVFGAAPRPRPAHHPPRFQARLPRARAATASGGERRRLDRRRRERRFPSTRPGASGGNPGSTSAAVDTVDAGAATASDGSVVVSGAAAGAEAAARPRRASSSVRSIGRGASTSCSGSGAAAPSAATSFTDKPGMRDDLAARILRGDPHRTFQRAHHRNARHIAHGQLVAPDAHAQHKRDRGHGPGQVHEPLHPRRLRRRRR